MCRYSRRMLSELRESASRGENSDELDGRALQGDNAWTLLVRAKSRAQRWVNHLACKRYRAVGGTSS